MTNKKLTSETEALLLDSHKVIPDVDTSPTEFLPAHQLVKLDNQTPATKELATNFFSKQILAKKLRQKLSRMYVDKNLETKRAPQSQIIIETENDFNFEDINNPKTANQIKNKSLLTKLTLLLKNISNNDFVWVFLIGLLFNLFIFRDLIVNWSAIINNQAIVAPDELVPIFNFQTQYLDQQLNPFSELTNNFEFRVRYSWLTTWWRGNNLLPATLIFFNAISLTLIYWSVKRFTSIFFEGKQVYKTWLFVGAFVGAFISYLILMYTKITHFYTLTFGFALWSVGLVWGLELFLDFYRLSRKQILRKVFFIVLITIFNPATHYVMLTIFVFGLLILTDSIFKIHEFFKEKAWPNFSRILVFIGTILSIAGGYLAYYYIFVTTFGKFGVQDFVGLTRRIIQASSSNIWQILSLQTGGILDFHHFGSYQIEPGNRLFNLIYSACAVIMLFITFRWQKLRVIGRHTKFLTFFNLSLTLLAVFFAIGYQSQYSAHNFASWVLSIIGYNSDILVEFQPLLSPLFSWFCAFRTDFYLYTN